MADPGDDNLREWLEAEAAGDDARADLLFATVFAHAVPRLLPPSSAARRVADALGHRRPAAPLALWLRVAAGVLLAFGGLAAAAFSPLWVVDVVRSAATLGPRVFRVAAVASSWAFECLRHAWQVADAVGRALAVASATGPAAAVIALNLTVAFAAAVALSRLLSVEQE